MFDVRVVEALEMWDRSLWDLHDSLAIGDVEDALRRCNSDICDTKHAYNAQMFGRSPFTHRKDGKNADELSLDFH